MVISSQRALNFWPLASRVTMAQAGDAVPDWPVGYAPWVFVACQVQGTSSRFEPLAAALPEVGGRLTFIVNVAPLGPSPASYIEMTSFLPLWVGATSPR